MLPSSPGHVSFDRSPSSVLRSYHAGIGMPPFSVTGTVGAVGSTKRISGRALPIIMAVSAHPIALSPRPWLSITVPVGPEIPNYLRAVAEGWNANIFRYPVASRSVAIAMCEAPDGIRSGIHFLSTAAVVVAAAVAMVAIAIRDLGNAIECWKCRAMRLVMLAFMQGVGIDLTNRCAILWWLMMEEEERTESKRGNTVPNTSRA